jgi:hypothetical protein
MLGQASLASERDARWRTQHPREAELWDGLSDDERGRIAAHPRPALAANAARASGQTPGGSPPPSPPARPTPNAGSSQADLAVPTPAVELWALAGASLIMIVLPFVNWYTASNGYSSLSATGWKAVNVLSGLMLICGLAGAWFAGRSLLAISRPTAARQTFVSHLIVLAGCLLLLWASFRGLVAPKFYVDYSIALDGGATPAVHVSTSAAPWLAALAAGASLWVGYAGARRQPHGFDVRLLTNIVRTMGR